MASRGRTPGAGRGRLWPFRVSFAARQARDFLGRGLLVAGAMAPATGHADLLVPPPDIQEKPSLASDGGQLLAVWSDQRDGLLPRVYWTRIATGPPDTLGTRITSAGGAAERDPQVAAAEGWALAVWESREDAGSGIQAAELPAATSGPLAVVPVSASGISVSRPAVALREDVGLILWEDQSGGVPDLRGATWRRGGAVTPAGGAPLLPAGPPRHHPRVAAGGSGFAALWSEAPPGGTSRVTVGLLDSAGVLVSGPATISSPAGNAHASDVIACGDGFLAVWTQLDQGVHVIAVRRLDASGLPVSEVAIHSSPQGNHRFAPRVTMVDGAMILGWVEQSPVGRGLKRGRIAPDLSLLPVEGIQLAPETTFAADLALGALGDSLVATWRHPLPGDDDDLHTVTVAPGDTADAGSAGPFLLVPPETTGIPAREGRDRGRRFLAYPNPSRAGVVIRGRPPLEAGEFLEILDLQGRRVIRLQAGPSGEVVWDGLGPGGRPAPAGIYFVRGARTPRVSRMLRLP